MKNTITSIALMASAVGSLATSNVNRSTLISFVRILLPTVLRGAHISIDSIRRITGKPYADQYPIETGLLLFVLSGCYDVVLLRCRRIGNVLIDLQRVSGG